MTKTKKQITGKEVKEFILDNAVIIMMVAVAVVVGILRPNFISAYNFKNLISNTAVRFIIALGVSGCLITKGTDLSAGRQVGFAACLAATLLQRADYSQKVFPNLPELPILAVVVGIILVFSLIGLINGLIIAILNVPPFIATLGMQTVVYGFCLVFTGAQPIGGLRPEYTNICSGSVFGITWIPYLGVIALCVGALMWVLYNKTPHGKSIYAIGGNENSAEVSGINVRKVKILVYMTASALYALAGFLLGGKAGGTSASLGQGYELIAIAGCTIGGVSSNGGIGKVGGILVGVLVFELLKIAMQFMGVTTAYTYVVQGLVIVIAVAFDIRKYVAKK